MSFFTQFNPFLGSFLVSLRAPHNQGSSGLSCLSAKLSSKFRGTHHEALQFFVTSSASFLNFRRKRCFSNNPSFVSTGLFISLLNVASLTLYASNAALLRTVKSSCQDLVS